MQVDLNPIDLVKSYPQFQRVFGYENQLQYSRERASQSLSKFQAASFVFSNFAHTYLVQSMRAGVAGQAVLHALTLSNLAEVASRTAGCALLSFSG